MHRSLTLSALLLALLLTSCTVPPAEPLSVLLLGDSISVGYTPAVQTELNGRARVVRPGENCAGTTKGIEHVDRWLAIEGGGWDVIHFNFGLHDLKRVQPDSGKNSNDPAHPHQASLAVYEVQLREITQRLQATGARLIFATTTPVPAGGVSPHREPGDVVAYNRVAVSLMKTAGIPVNDLFRFAMEYEHDIQLERDVHFTEDGSSVLGRRVSQAILEVAGLGDSSTDGVLTH
jgi:acyl-CoA thioesterase-1